MGEEETERERDREREREREHERVYLLVLYKSGEEYVTLLQLLFDHID